MLLSNKNASSVIEMETFFSQIIKFFPPKIFLFCSIQFNILTRVVSYCIRISEEAMKKKDVMISSELIDLIGARWSGLEIVIWSWSWSWRLCQICVTMIFDKILDLVWSNTIWSQDNFQISCQECNKRKGCRLVLARKLV